MATTSRKNEEHDPRGDKNLDLDLTSNWLIDFKHLVMGKKIGHRSFGW